MCRFRYCPFVLSFLCLWSPVKMVYYLFVFWLSVQCSECRPTIGYNAKSICEGRAKFNCKFNFDRTKQIAFSDYQITKKSNMKSKLRLNATNLSTRIQPRLLPIRCSSDTSGERYPTIYSDYVFHLLFNCKNRIKNERWK